MPAFTRLASQAITHSSSLGQSMVQANSVAHPSTQGLTASPVVLPEPDESEPESPVEPLVVSPSVPLLEPLPLVVESEPPVVPPSPPLLVPDEVVPTEPVVLEVVPSPASSSWPGSPSSLHPGASAPSTRSKPRIGLMAVYDSARSARGTLTSTMGRLTRGLGITGIACAIACVEPPPTPSDDDGSSSGTSATSMGTSTGPADSSDSTTGSPEQGWMTSLEVGEGVGAFFSVWGPAPSMVYAVASQPLDGGLSAGALQRWDGNAWSALPLPPDTSGLNWVFGTGDRRFLVGELGVILVRDGDEGEWTRYGCETILPLWGVWAAAPDDAWAVGGDGFNRDPIACHFDGEAWTQATLPELSIESHALYKVWGTASDDVWAVGQDGLLMHWTGEAEGWVEVPSGTTSDLISLWGTGPDEILAVGGRTTATLARYDGTSWAVQDVPEVLGLNGIWMASDGTATVVGPFGGAGVVEPGALSITAEDSGTILALHGVFGFDGVERWAVGGSLDMAPPYVGIALRRIP